MPFNQQENPPSNVEDSEGWEEYYDYIFPDDEDQKKSIKILEKAVDWHKTKQNLESK